MEIQAKNITLLDGDVIRQNLSKGLGFSKKDRDMNIARIGFVANEITRHNGIVICAAIAPYEEARQKNRFLIEKNGHYIEVYVSTPPKVCAQRDKKGLYQMSKKGTLKGLTGVDDVYEIPDKPEITINTESKKVAECVGIIISYLQKNNLISLS
jgi:sulfate adenylyltransferase